MKKIAAHELVEAIKKGDLTIINVLENDCFKDCHIKGSINIPSKDLEAKMKDWDREKPLVVYCASYHCPASANAYEILVAMGFKNVRAYEGGMKEWVALGYPSQGACKMKYLFE